MKKCTSLLFSMLSLSLLFSCNDNVNTIKEGKYSVVSIEFKDGTSPEKMKEHISSMKDFEVVGNSLVLTPDSSVTYKYVDGYLFVNIGKVEKKYECEIDKSGNDISYDILLNEGDVKKVIIKNVSPS